MYELINATKRYKQKNREVVALNSVTLSIKTGDMVAIQGPTGGGKSTLLQLLGGLDRPSSGSIDIDGNDIAELSDNELAAIRARLVGFVFQNFNLIPTLSAIENVELALVPLAIEKGERRTKALAALASVGLADRADHLPHELSGGQQQRTAIARALVKEPSVLLADEPTGNLDEDTRDEIIELLENLWRSQGITLIIVTHDSAVAKRAKTRLNIKNGVVSQVS